MDIPGEEDSLNQNTDSIPAEPYIGNYPSGNSETLNDQVEDDSVNEGAGFPKDGNVSRGDTIDDEIYFPGLRRSTRKTLALLRNGLDISVHVL